MSEIKASKSNRISHASPWIFAAAGLLLSLIISVFAVNNYRREKVVMGKVLVQEGQAIINLTASAARAALKETVMRSNLDREKVLDLIQQVIAHGSEHPQIVALFLADESGEILAHSDQNLRFKKIDQDTINYLKSIKIQNPVANSRILDKDNDSEQVFQIASPFHVFGYKNDRVIKHWDMNNRRGQRMMREGMPPVQLETLLKEVTKKEFYLIATLDMSDYRISVQKQLVQIIILSVVLLLVGLAGFISMITLQGFKGTQIRLKRMSAFTDILISSMPVGIIAVNTDGLIKTCNGSGGKILGVDSEKIQNLHYKEVFPEELLAFLTGGKAENNDRSTELEVEIEGIIKVLAVEKVAVEDTKSKQSGTMLLIQNLTTQKKLERELRRNERHTALGKMAAGVAHELRNPLSSIKGLAILLRNKIADDQSSMEATDVMISEVERLDRSIGELLDYARPKNLDIRSIDLNDIIGKAVMLIETDAKNAGIEILYKLAPGGCLINGDQDRLTQVFLNLFLNSIQAMAEGGQLFVATATDHDLAIITVKDSGSGVDSEVMEKIFDPYFTTKNEGTGLGLSLSAKIVEDHRGTIDFESVKDLGTIVTITLPL